MYSIFPHPPIFSTSFTFLLGDCLLSVVTGMPTASVCYPRSFLKNFFSQLLDEYEPTFVLATTAPFVDFCESPNALRRDAAESLIEIFASGFFVADDFFLAAGFFAAVFEVVVFFGVDFLFSVMVRH